MVDNYCWLPILDYDILSVATHMFLLEVHIEKKIVSAALNYFSVHVFNFISFKKIQSFNQRCLKHLQIISMYG